MTPRHTRSSEWNERPSKASEPKPGRFLRSTAGHGSYLDQNAAGVASGATDPPQTDSDNLARSRSFSFSRDASIVLTGPRGNGKSSLAIMAGLLLRRQVIDVDDRFSSEIGCSSSALKRKHGVEKYLSEQLELTRTLFTRYEKGCIIACGPCITAEECRDWIMEYRKTHPVIYVIRPTEDLAEYLGLEKLRLQQRMKKIRAIYLGISNLEFSNLPETWKEATERCPAQDHFRSILHHRLVENRRAHTLQKTQAALARFLTATLGHPAASLAPTVFPTIYPNLPEHRIYSNVACIPISSLTSEDIDISQISAGADAVELILDGRNEECRSIAASGALSQFVAEVRYFHAVPIIYHIHMEDIESTDWKLYFDLLYEGMRSAPEYLTVCLSAPESGIRLLSSKRGRIKIIGHRDTAVSPHYWQSREPLGQYQRALELGCDLVRLVNTGDTMVESFSCMVLVNKINGKPNHSPIIAYNTSNIGRLSLVCNPVLSPVLPMPSSRTQWGPNIRSPTDMTVSERWKFLFMLKILDPLHFLVVGSCVQKSLSPALHNAGFRALGMPHTYRIHEAKSLGDIEALFVDPNFGGASVSSPFKTRAFSFAKKLSPAAKFIGGSNTIIPVRNLPDHHDHADPRDRKQRHRAGPVAMLYADNTDWMGICACLSRSISPANSVNPATAGLVVGAGGMARAAVYCLLRLGVRNICIFNRTVSNAQAMATHFRAVFADYVKENQGMPFELGHQDQPGDLDIKVLPSIITPWPEDFSQPSIVICAIKAYSHRNSTTLPFTIPHSWMKNPTGGIVVEAAYHTPETPLMEHMREETHLGWTLVDPIEVFFEQACAQWELFTGSRAPRKVMWEACLNEYANKMKNHEDDSI